MEPAGRKRHLRLPRHGHSRPACLALPGSPRNTARRRMGPQAPPRRAVELLPHKPRLPPLCRRTGAAGGPTLPRPPCAVILAHRQRIWSLLLLRYLRGTISRVAAGALRNARQPEHALGHPILGHTFNDWSQIEPPSRLGEQTTQGILLDYKRFMSDMNLECFLQEAAVLREFTPNVPLTTNFHGSPVKSLDYFAWAPHQDIIAWDFYPSAEEPPDSVAFRHDIMRGLKAGQPWLLMEQTPSQTQWRDFNPLKRPGEMRLKSYQAIARGSDGAMFFQWRQSRGSGEMHHGAIVSHAGHSQTRVFQEIKTLGSELQGLGSQFLGSRIEARVALMFSWPNWWAVEYKPGLSSALDYLDEVRRYYSVLWRRNIAVDVIGPTKDDGRTKVICRHVHRPSSVRSKDYDLVIAPLLYMVSEEQSASIEEYVAGGGTFLTTYFSGVVDEDGRAWLGGPPGPLRKTLGMWVEEVDPCCRASRTA